MVWLFVALGVILIAFVAWTVSRDRQPTGQPVTGAQHPHQGSDSPDDKSGGHRGCC